ncbi:DNA repair protein RecN [Leeia sp. TBRC 13508]|uniref:DNA repair protein RecN n=1 Tax=Leeia speluncae TaxID=2884804 RepID=A0ABS8D911_9NEIS|nr:DNA repair protein RecN [Leeia speluncae]MCB6184513.1 DNA repair protein RecN [Leeia speluncae]
MLLTLNIRDFVIVDRLELQFSKGFTVLTGETGAGKSLLIDALSLLLGGRFDSGMVRLGQERADLTAEFDIQQMPHVATWLTENQLEGEDTQLLVLRRTLDKQGRSRSFINGTVATVQQLKEIGEWLIDIHGQHAHQSLMRGDYQRQMLDAFGECTQLTEAVNQYYKVWKQSESALNEALANQSKQEEVLAQIEWRINELKPIAIPTEAYQELVLNHTRMSHASALEEVATQGSDLLQESSQAIIPQLTHYLNQLKDQVEIDPQLKEPSDLIEGALIQLQEAAYSLRHYAGRQELDPQVFKQLDEQLSDIHTMARKLKSTPEALYSVLEEALLARKKAAALADIAGLTAEVKQNRQLLDSKAKQLSEARKAAAKTLSDTVTRSLALLSMERTRFEVSLNPLNEPNAFGLEQIEYRISHHGAPGQSLAKVASGGELSRISLAIQVAMSAVASVPTLIFDEVDVGIGGKVADTVGGLLQALGKEYQVLSITHLPQVAAKGHHHWQVSKGLVDDRVTSRIHVLGESERIEEISRMLGGAEITETTRQHAKEMLAY